MKVNRAAFGFRFSAPRGAGPTKLLDQRYRASAEAAYDVLNLGVSFGSISESDHNILSVRSVP